MSNRIGTRAGVAAVALMALASWSFGAQQAPAELAKEVLRAGGVPGGLAVCLGGDGQLVAELARGGKFVVHGLLADPAVAAAARQKLAADGLAGLAAVESLPAGTLPYADNLVSLLVAEDASAAPLPEVMRVLRPQGVACLSVKPDARKAVEAALATAGIAGGRFEQLSRLWLVLTKPRPEGMDDWTHWNHGPDGNLVSQDRLIDRPNQIQWIAGPQWGDHRGAFVWGAGSPSGVRSAGTRNYYIIGSQLVARDAFNGVMLWARKVTGLNASLVVASGEEVYLVGDGKIVAISGATGEDLRTYGQADRCRDLILADGLLLAFEGRQVRAFDAASGAEKWSSAEAAGAAGPVVGAGKVYCAGSKLVCVSLADGKVRWTRPGKVEMLFAFADKVLVRTAAEGERAKTAYTYTALRGADGETAWSFTADRTGERYVEAYFAADLVWVQSAHDRALRENTGFHNPKGGSSYQWRGLDPATGKVTRTFLQPVTLQYRCHRLYVTDRFLIGNRPVYFTDWRDEKVTRFEATRIACGSVCGLGQGMFYGLYTNSSQCMCVRPAMSGITAYRYDGATMDGAPTAEAEGLLEKGPASAPKPPAASADDWPMYRHDMHRTACADAVVPGELKIAWKRDLLAKPAPAAVPANDWRLDRVFSDPASQPTVAGGKVFVALTQAQQVAALDARTGKEAWRFHAPARLGAPPTVHKGLCLVGCHDGWVYALRADDGKLVWRFRAAPAERRIVAYGQVESAWPVTGGVLIAGEKAYVIAGRTTEADGGVYVHALDPATGKALWSARRVKPDDGAIGAWNLRGLKDDYFGPSDVLCSDGATVAISAHRAGRFACDSGKNVSGGGIAGPKFGLMRSRYAADNQRVSYPPVAFVGSESLKVATVRDNATRKTSSFVSLSGKGGWKAELPAGATIESLAIAGDTALAAVSTRGGAGEVWVFSRADGKKLGSCPLPTGPAFEGLSAAGGKVYVALQNGAVACLAGK
ncbi:MAG TPA: PQQ-binding-like beta-propeller repeat protein [Phycisphaerae bacterium]|nr:PQQ-binding-like beta-propeller repeat protein [Phycisphaerae bacterium]